MGASQWTGLPSRPHAQGDPREKCIATGLPSLRPPSVPASKARARPLTDGNGPDAAHLEVFREGMGKSTVGEGQRSLMGETHRGVSLGAGGAGDAVASRRRFATACF